MEVAEVLTLSFLICSVPVGSTPYAPVLMKCQHYRGPGTPLQTPRRGESTATGDATPHALCSTHFVWAYANLMQRGTRFWLQKCQLHKPKTITSVDVSDAVAPKRKPLQTRRRDCETNRLSVHERGSLDAHTFRADTHVVITEAAVLGHQRCALPTALQVAGAAAVAIQHPDALLGLAPLQTLLLRVALAPGRGAGVR